MLNHLKTHLRNALPQHLQVPAKYWYGRSLGRLEREMRFLDALVHRQDRVIDVGGNRGIYAYHLWRLGAQVEVFEPHPHCQRVLRAWASDKPAVSLHPVALSNRSGVATLRVPAEASGLEHDASASLEVHSVGLYHCQDVSTRTLDSYGFEGIAFIKIDVEGHERSVIEGGAATISASCPALLVEIEQRHVATPIAEVFAQVRGLGYQGFFLHHGRLHDLDSFDIAHHQPPGGLGDPATPYINNFLFLHRRKLAQRVYDALLTGSAPA